jgi:hypothetical protein
LLNQYDNRTVPGYLDVLGSANSNATVTVNLQPVSRQGEYFRKEYAVNNANTPVWLGLTNLAVLNQGGTLDDIVTTNLGYTLVPPTPQTFWHDADGNFSTRNPDPDLRQ